MTTTTLLRPTTSPTITVPAPIGRSSSLATRQLVSGPSATASLSHLPVGLWHEFCEACGDVADDGHRWCPSCDWDG